MFGKKIKFICLLIMKIVKSQLAYLLNKDMEQMSRDYVLTRALAWVTYVLLVLTLGLFCYETSEYSYHAVVFVPCVLMAVVSSVVITKCHANDFGYDMEVIQWWGSVKRLLQQNAAYDSANLYNMCISELYAIRPNSREERKFAKSPLLQRLIDEQYNLTLMRASAARPERIPAISSLSA
jgi:hypothetical protein